MADHQTASAVFGALVADAAALGLHWIYDVDRVAEVAARTGSAAFVPVDGANFEGVPAYFAHAQRRCGMLSQYGEVLSLTIRSILAEDGFEVSAYQKAYRAHFEAGGSYEGYIDRPTRGTLANLAAETSEPSGIDDDQLPAVATLPAIFARYGAGAKLRKAAMEVTNVNDSADAYGAVFEQVLAAVVEGKDVKSALSVAAKGAHGDIREPLLAALSTDESDSVAYGAITERACHLGQAMPLCFHILNHATDFRDGVERNIRAGGDSCGRAIVIGSILGAAFGVEAKQGVPLEWALQLHDGAALWRDCQAL